MQKKILISGGMPLLVFDPDSGADTTKGEAVRFPVDGFAVIVLG
jgi:hypothetical protein